MTCTRFDVVAEALDKLYYSIQEAKDAVEELRRLAQPTAAKTQKRLDEVAAFLTQAQDEFRETEPCDAAFDDETEADCYD